MPGSIDRSTVGGRQAQRPPDPPPGGAAGGQRGQQGEHEDGGDKAAHVPASSLECGGHDNSAHVASSPRRRPLPHLGVIRARATKPPVPPGPAHPGFRPARPVRGPPGRLLHRQGPHAGELRRLQARADEILLACSASLLAPTLKRLSMFVLRAKAKLSDASAELALYGLAGEAVPPGGAVPGRWRSPAGRPRRAALSGRRPAALLAGAPPSAPPAGAPRRPRCGNGARCAAA